MEKIYSTRYELALNDDGNTHIKVSVDYNRDPYGNNVRGYYISAYPVKVEDIGNGLIIEHAHAFSGYKELLNEVKRRSKKAEAEALKLANELETVMVDIVLTKNKYNLA